MVRRALADRWACAAPAAPHRDSPAEAVADSKAEKVVSALCRMTPRAPGGDIRKTSGHCACRECNPRKSGGMLVLVQDAAEMVAPADVQPDELVRVGDHFKQWSDWSGVGDALVW